MQSESEELDFSSHWHFSDAVLNVGGKTFHVHRCVLSMWSAILDKELKNTSKMSVECKSPEDVRELLLVIYPTRKPVTQDNAHILLPLAYDFNMGLLISMCEDVLLKGIEVVRCTDEPLNQQEEDLIIDRTLPLLIVAIKYNLKPLRKQCINSLMGVRLSRLKSKAFFNNLDVEDRMELAEGRVAFYERRETSYRA